MGEKNRQYDLMLGRGSNSDRLQFFSDAVFAIAMTLLVIDITVPVVRNVASTTNAQLNAELWTAVGAQWPQFLAYAISFWIIGINWVAHHRKFTVTRRFDGRLITINLVLLFFIAFVPYPTSLLSEYGGAIPAIVLYTAVVSIISLLQTALWVYSYRHGLLDERVDLGMYRYIRRNSLVVPVVFLLSIPVGLLFGGVWAMFFWILNWPLSRIVGNYEPRAKDAARSR
jgi:uncharacterized membrane protein